MPGEPRSLIAIEGAWPDAWRVNRYVQGEAGDSAKPA